jgi:phosphoribosyl 1,2-cyclic phosphodiesterase
VPRPPRVREPDGHERLLIEDGEARVELVEELVGVEAEELGVLAQEGACVRAGGELVEPLRLERAEVLAPDPRLFLSIGDRQTAALARLAKAHADRDQFDRLPANRATFSSVRIRFLGTRGEIEARTRRHSRHSALVVAVGRREVMIDAGDDWRGRLARIRPSAVVLTHAHPDHAGGLRDGTPATVYATEETWSVIERYPVGERVIVRPREPFRVGRLHFEAFPVEHSIRAPAVGYRIEAGSAAVFYAPDLVSIADEGEALGGLDLYVGDGAAIGRSIIRYREGRPIGHASIRVQLDWCAEAGVPWAVFTHCGSEIVKGDTRAVAARVDGLGRERGIRVEIARDGLELVV